MSSTDFDTGQGTIVPGENAPPVAAAETTLDRTKTPTSPVPVGVVPHASDISVEERLERIEQAFTSRLNINLYEFDTTPNRAIALQTATDAVVTDLAAQQASAEEAGATLPVTPGNISVVQNADGSSTTMWADGTTATQDAQGNVTSPRSTADVPTGTSGSAITGEPGAAAAPAAQSAEADALAIHDYDAQTIESLGSGVFDTLTDEELDAVEQYEVANQNRVGVLDLVAKRRLALEAEEEAPA